MPENIPQIDTRVISGKGNDRRGYQKRSFTRDNWQSYEPTLGDKWPSEQNVPPEELYYTEATVQREPHYDIVTFHYTVIKDAYFRSTVKTTRQSRPLSEREDYKTGWDHILVTTNSDTTRPEWYETSKDPLDGNADNVAYKWVKGTVIPNDWKPVDDGSELYKNINSYNVYNITVNQTIYFKNKEVADAQIVGFLGKLIAPSDTHGLPSEDIYWLCSNVDVTIEGSYYRVQLMFEYKDEINKDGQRVGWDTDLYEAAAS